MDIVEFVEKVCEFFNGLSDFMMIGSETYYSVKENGDI